MIIAEFYSKDNFVSRFEIKGHSGYSEAGSDIVCAAVTSAVETIINIISDQFKIDSDTRINEKNAEIAFLIKDSNKESLNLADKLLKGLYYQLKTIAEDYPKFIRLTIMEV